MPKTNGFRKAETSEVTKRHIYAQECSKWGYLYDSNNYQNTHPSEVEWVNISYTYSHSGILLGISKNI